MTIKSHLDGLLGSSSSTLLQTEGVEVRLWPDTTCPGIGVVCTVGMSNRVQSKRAGESCPSNEPRVELLSYCRVADAGTFGKLLLDLSQYTFRDGHFVFWWHSIDLGRPLCDGSTIVGLMLSFPPFSADQVTFNVDGKRRDLVWVVPLCASELEFCRTKGVEAFENILERANIDIADISRPPVLLKNEENE